MSTDLHQRQNLERSEEAPPDEIGNWAKIPPSNLKAGNPSPPVDIMRRVSWTSWYQRGLQQKRQPSQGRLFRVFVHNDEIRR
jgi:hypothetical protein